MNPEMRLVRIGGDVPSPGGLFVRWEGDRQIIERMEYVPFSNPPRAIVLRDGEETKEQPVASLFICGRVVLRLQRVDE